MKNLAYQFVSFSSRNSFPFLLEKSGRFVTESEVEERVKEMEKTRERLLERLEYQISLNPHPPAKKEKVEEKI